MSHAFSVLKSVDPVKILTTTFAASLLATGLASGMAPQNQQQMSQLAVASSVNNELNESEEQGSNSTLMLVALVAGGIATGVMLSKKGNRRQNNFSFGEQQTSTIRLEQASRKLQRKLINLLHDDRDAATRLLNQAKQKNPNKTIDWYAEKVIYDLERDRGGL
ncbi:hypothetical protein ACF3DV_15165 [Chlorogloeopsis fritschii PCC 9212]|uniref:Uncharacterized protein n=1 Tax=Chlorogloeopsis fritschii PCC 6912 TaxID=211165 RepID=A0A3S1AL35_CHLFR|nr:hypothetical protein [Chlorogloeopsis fritschii]RUR83476.1 hypothetical protein PCC6912_23090 [Chlorogloeopsis fritschii PCC 6912]